MADVRWPTPKRRLRYETKPDEPVLSPEQADDLLNRGNISPGLTCAADKEARTVLMTFPAGWFDERRAYAMFGEAVSVLLGRKRSLVPVERWVDLEAADGGT